MECCQHSGLQNLGAGTPSQTQRSPCTCGGDETESQGEETEATDSRSHARKSSRTGNNDIHISCCQPEMLKITDGFLGTSGKNTYDV